jgi:hypothetical protein
MRTDLPPGTSYAHGLSVVAYDDLQGRPSFKMAMYRAAGRWYLYTMALWEPGFTILDVTEPSVPRFVRFVPGPPNTWTLQIQIAGTTMVTSYEQAPPAWGGDPSRPNAEGLQLWDLADPEDPRPLGTFATGGTGTHRNYYDGGRYVYATSALAGYDGHVLQIVDIDDPTHPREVSRWWRRGQWTAGGESGAPPSTALHGGAYILGERAFLPYGGAGLIVLDVHEKGAPQLVSELPFSPPFQAFIGVHTAQPLTHRPLVVVNSEAIAENGDEPLGFAGIVDVRDETAPRLISLFPLPYAPDGAPYKNFAEKGGRFGPHNQHQWQYQDVLLHDENLVFLTYFNAGLRVYDIRDERQPREIAFFVPPDPRERRGLLPTSALVAQSEDVLVDARGTIYLTDKNHGLYVLRLDGQTGGRFSAAPRTGT